jgi:capsular polysaccharide biosynthesis protein
MDLREYARVLFRRGWIIVVVAIVGAVGALLFSRIQTPVYRSAITLSAVPTRQSDYGQGLAIKNLLRLYSQQIQTKMIAQQVIDQLQLDIPPEKFLGGVEVSPNEADYTLQIAVKDTNIDMVQPMVQRLAENFVILHQQENLQMDQNDRILVNILDNASPAERFSPRTTINVIAGAILGALAGALAVFAIEYVQSGYIRKPEDIERSLQLTVLGTIPTIRGKDASPRRQASLQPRPSGATENV